MITKPVVAKQTHETPAVSKAPPTPHNNALPYVASNIDDFIKYNAQLQTQHERKISSSSDNDDYEPYTRRDRDFRIEAKPSNDTSSGYFTSPNENEKLSSVPNVMSPDSSDYEKYELQKSVIKNRDEYSSSPVDSQSGRSVSSQRKSVSFDLDVEEYTPDYTPIDDEAAQTSPKFDDSDVFYEKSRYHHNQLQPEPKRIKGILRSPSPNVYYKGNVSNRVPVEEEYIEDDGEESERENPFRKEYLSQEGLNVSGVISDSAPSEVRYESVRRSFENLSGGGAAATSKIPIMKPIFKSSGSLVDRPKIPPPRPPQPTIKVAEKVKNEGLKRMSAHMEQKDFVEFVHNAETNTVEEVKTLELFDPDDPLPPLPKCPPPPLDLTYKRMTSFDRPKVSPPPPPTPKRDEILEILPATFDKFPMKQKPHFVNENSQRNILVTEDEHREILLGENEIRNAMLTEYDENVDNKSELLIDFSSTNPFLDDSFESSSLLSTPNVMSPVSTSSFDQYVPTYQSAPHVQPINILPPPPQVLPVHYGQLPKPQHAGYYPLMTHQYPIPYNAPSSGYVAPPPPPPNYVQQPSVSEMQQQQQNQRAYLVSGDGQNNFYVTHNVNNTNANNQQQTLLMQSAYGPSLSQPSPPNQTSLQQLPMHMQAHSQYVASTPPTNNQPQFIYEQQQQHYQQQQQYYPNSLRNNHVQFVQQHSELSPIRVNQVPQNFIYPANAGEQKSSLSSFGKQTEV